jgi:uncharacterized protein
MSNPETIQYLDEAEARELYISGDAAHDFDHVLRVTHLAEQIASAEGADVQIVRLAALLHDVPVSDTRSAHHLAAAAYANELLTSRGLGTEQVENIVHSIEAHRFRDRSIQPKTLEAMCLYDADKLDSIGAIGIARCFAYAGANDSRLWIEPWSAVSDRKQKPEGSDYTPVHEFVYKLQNLLATLHTETARRIGRERHTFMIKFYNQLDREVENLA